MERNNHGVALAIKTVALDGRRLKIGLERRFNAPECSANQLCNRAISVQRARCGAPVVRARTVRIA